MNIWAVIPARPLEEGKSRLAAILPPAERLRLNETFFRQTLDVVAGVVGPARTLAVSRSAALLRIAQSMGVGAFAEQEPYGLNEALGQAAQAVRAQGAEGILTISCDLPFLVPDDLRALIAAAEEGAGMVIAGDRDGSGTNALVLSPVGAIAYRYGAQSFAIHQAAAGEAKLTTRTIQRIGLAFDVDTPADLDQMEDIRRETTRAKLNTAP
jgi:2-phospho-L-lactate guanylyltransferase